MCFKVFADALVQDCSISIANTLQSCTVMYFMISNCNLMCFDNLDSKVHGANVGPTWVLSAPDGPHVGPMNLAIWEVLELLLVAYISEAVCSMSSNK